MIGRGAALLAALAAVVVAAPLALSLYLLDADGSEPPPPPRLSTLRMVNYYPSAGGWSLMWTRFDRSAVDAGFGRAQWLGANTVRLFVQPAAFGYPVPQARMLDRLERVLALADAHGLRVGLVLFDGFHDYGDRAGSERWARAVLAPHAEDPRLRFVEVRNEVDPRNRAAMAWTRDLLGLVGRLAPDLPRTVSAPGTGGAATLARLRQALDATRPDFFNVHVYGGAEWAYAALEAARRAVAPVPLIVGETGYATLPGNPRGLGVPATQTAQEDWQARFLETVGHAARALGLPPPAPWTLDDFTRRAIPLSTVARRPEQYRYGLFRTDGTPKPAAAVVRRMFRSGSIETAIANGFEQPLRTTRGSLPLGWRVWHPDAARFAWDDGVAHGGGASARISQSHGTPTAVPAFFASPVDGAVVPGVRYRVSAWLRGAASTGENRVSIAWYDAAHHYVGQSESRALPEGDTPWIRLSASGRAPARAAAYQIHLKSSHNHGTVWFDDVEVGLP